jgi:hypothetical protein
MRHETGPAAILLAGLLMAAPQSPGEASWLRDLRMAGPPLEVPLRASPRRERPEESEAPSKEDRALLERVVFFRGDFDGTDLQLLVDLGAALQKRPPAEAARLLDHLPQRIGFLLHRFIFELPEVQVRSDLYWRWRNGTGTYEDRSVTWPISWRYGRPQYVGGFGGYDGPPYRASADFFTYRLRYPYRRLPALVAPTRGRLRQRVG